MGESVQGIQGIQGTSVQGMQGRQGLQGTSVQGSSGTSQGIQGLQGPQGTSVQGMSGTSQGIQGLQGIQGRSVQGLSGTSQGIQGLQGFQGLQGISVQGASGAQGVTGTVISLPVTQIPNAADLNQYITPGTYHQSADVQAAAGTNYPVALSGLLEVYASSLMVYQRYTVYNSGQIYTRSSYNSSWYAWRLELDSGNYNSYAPTLTGTGATGIWNITGRNPTQSFNANWNTDFADAPAGSMISRGDTSSGSATGGPGGTYWFQENFRHNNGAATWGTQIAWGWEDNANQLKTRNVQNGTFGNWTTYLNSNNYNSYALPLSGGTMTGTIYSDVNSAVIMRTGGVVRGYLYSNTEGGGLLSGAGGWAVRVNDGTNNVYMPGNLNVATLNVPGRIYANEWVQFDNYSGLYSPLNNAHFRPNEASYGSWRVLGTRNGWSGLEFQDAGSSLMMNDNVYGIHHNSIGWRFYQEGENFYVKGNITAYWSDKRLKENIKPIGKEANEILSKLSAYRFNWNDKVSEFSTEVKPGKEEIGLIAQEVQEALPDAVSINKAGNKVNPNGEQTKSDYLTINWNKITPLIVQALNDTTRELNDLKQLLKDKGII